MLRAELPKINTIGIRYIEGIIKDVHYGQIIEKILGVPRNEVYGIDVRPDGKIMNKFLFKVTTYNRYKVICAKFSGREFEIEKGYRIQVEDISSNNTRVFISMVPFEVSNTMLKDVFRKYGKVHTCVNYNQNYGMYNDLKGQGNRIVWMKLNHHIPQNIEINQAVSHILVKYPGQVSTCHNCGHSGHESRSCRTAIDQRVNKIDLDLNLEKLNKTASVDSDITIHVNSSLDSIKFACEFCDYCCTDEAILDVHMATHTGEKPFICNNCENKFKSSSDLEVHMATHTGEQTCKCNVCGKNFKGKEKLNDHSKVHMGQFRHSSKNTNKNLRKKIIKAENLQLQQMSLRKLV